MINILVNHVDHIWRNHIGLLNMVTYLTLQIHQIRLVFRNEMKFSVSSRLYNEVSVLYFASRKKFWIWVDFKNAMAKEWQNRGFPRSKRN